MLHKLQHEPSTICQDSPHSWFKPAYGAKVKCAYDEDNSPILPPNKINKIHQKYGILLYYGVNVDLTKLVSLGSISSPWSKSTYHTSDDMKLLMEYSIYEPDVSIHYHTSDIVLHAHINAPHRPKSKLYSSYGAQFLFTGKLGGPTKNPIQSTLVNMNFPHHMKTFIRCFWVWHRVLNWWSIPQCPRVRLNTNDPRENCLIPNHP